MADSNPQMVASDVVDAMFAELQTQRDKALKDSVDKAATIFSLTKEVKRLTAEVEARRESNAVLAPKHFDADSLEIER